MGIFSTTSLKTVARLLIALVLLASSAIAQAQSMSDAGSCRADVVFLMDNTGSMGGPIRNTKRNASAILDAISGGDRALPVLIPDLRWPLIGGIRENTSWAPASTTVIVQRARGPGAAATIVKIQEADATVGIPGSAPVPNRQRPRKPVQPSAPSRSISH